MNRFRPLLIAVCCSATLVACSSSDSKPSSPRGSKGTTSVTDAGTYLGLAEPTDGFQVRSIGTTIPAGADEEYCEIEALPGDSSQTYYVSSMEFGNGAESHHLIVSAVVAGATIESSLHVGDITPCLGAQLQYGETGIEGVGGIQQPYGRIDFPEGVGREYHGGQLVIFDYHYLNSSTMPVHALSAFNFHLTDASKIQHIARQFGFYNFTIDTPANATGSFTGECHFKNDVTVGGLSRHTHRWGTQYAVSYAGGANDGQNFWTSNDWEHDVEHDFSPPTIMKAGEGFRFRCDYDNTTTHDLRFGTSATDEMCILFGLVWEASDGETIGDQGCQISWVDSNGIGHPASDDGGFPKPSDGAVAACTSGATPNGGTIDPCTQCDCDSCADTIIKCFTDADCGPILSCVRSNNCGGDCTNVCFDTFHAHSSGVGLIQQVQACTQSRCSSVCGTHDGGTTPAASDAGQR